MTDRPTLADHLNQNHPAPSKDRVVLLSGGLDSYVTLLEAVRSAENHARKKVVGGMVTVYPLGFDYGQKCIVELEYAKRQIVSTRLHRLVRIEGLRTMTLRGLEVGAMADGDTDMQSAEVEDVPDATVVPMRNAIFLSLAYGYAEAIGAGQIWCGFTDAGADGGFTPDTRIEFVQAMALAMRLGSANALNRSSPELHTPLLRKPTKAAALVRAKQLGADLSLVWSCYSGSKKAPCGRCRACCVLSAAKELLASADDQRGVSPKPRRRQRQQEG